MFNIAFCYRLALFPLLTLVRQGVTGVFYGPHSSHEHFWVRDPDDLQTLMEGEGGDGLRPQVFVSRGKHASYPVAGKGMLSRVTGFHAQGVFLCSCLTA